MLREISAGHRLQFSQTQPVGCLIERADVDVTSQQLTFCRDIAPIVFANCMRCHREASALLFPLTSDEEVRDRAVKSRRWSNSESCRRGGPGEGFGRFLNERCLNSSDIERITAGVRTEPPAAIRPTFLRLLISLPAGSWESLIFVLTMPEEYEIPADGPDIYRIFVIPTRLRQDCLASTFEFRPGSCAWSITLGSISIHRGRPADSTRRIPGPGYTNFGGPGFSGASSLGGWSPGGLPRRLPAGLGRQIPRAAFCAADPLSSDGKMAERDRSTIGFYFCSPDRSMPGGRDPGGEL